MDGNDLFAVISATRRAVEHAASGKGPTIIEALTYRMGGHSTSDDPNAYRKKDELKPWVERDPIERLKRYLVHHDKWSQENEEQLRTEIDQTFRQAVETAENTPPPALETMFEDVFEKPSWNLVEQRAQLLAGPRAPSSH